MLSSGWWDMRKTGLGCASMSHCARSGLVRGANLMEHKEKEKAKVDNCVCAPGEVKRCIAQLAFVRLPV